MCDQVRTGVDGWIDGWMDGWMDGGRMEGKEGGMKVQREEGMNQWMIDACNDLRSIQPSSQFVSSS